MKMKSGLRAKKILISLLLCFWCCSFAMAQEQVRIMYHSPGANNVRVMRNIKYRDLGMGQELKFDFFEKPAKERRPGPVVILMNGFGDPTLKDNPIQTEWAKLIAGDGLSAVTFQSHPEDVAGDFDS